MFRYLLRYSSLLILWVVVGQPSISLANQAYPNHCSTVVGTASTEGVTEEYARRIAIRNALKLASMQNNLKIQSTQEVNSFQLTKDTVRFTTQSKVSKFKVREEGLKKPSFNAGFDDQGMPIKMPKPTTYQVVLDVCVTEDPAACGHVLGNYLQPKLAIAQVVITDTSGASDISNLTAGFQLELDRRLGEHGYKNLILLHAGGRLQESSQLATPSLIKAKLTPIRENTGAQYLLLNVIRTVGRQVESSRWNDIKRYYNQEVAPHSRYIEVDVYLVDLIAQETVYTKRYGFDVEGEVTVGRGRPFGTNAFYATDTGMVFNTLLEQEVSGIKQFLKCKPLSAQIIDIRDGEYILFLSAQSGAKVGDELTVYHQFGRPILKGGVNLGFVSSPTGFLKITRIQSKFAIAKLITKKGLIQVGDEVRSW